ncbi:hypothetical protein [Paenarthrobacter nitroguajacolicus]|uniref:hypothetical protein n=1 Tax=Paenarthrobacter nitroguajacolicus TaxID=211146 RepID=UPI0015BDA50B|nr:hypothetical protein [Paenarthrobacter nitroguajacolicus]NWL35536.1 hypothetical protein [Paenarthrobacter nitroguajacolicus]
MNRLEQARAAARRSSEIAAARRARIPGWTEPTEEMTERRRLMNREFVKAQGAADIFYALKAERLAAQEGTSVDSPETAI